MEGKYILGRMGLYFGGESELMLRIWGAKKEYFQGAEEFSFGDLGRSKHYFQGSREHRPQGGGLTLARPQGATPQQRYPQLGTELLDSSTETYTRMTNIMGGSRGGDRGSGPPLLNHKNIGFLSNTGPGPLKNHKAINPAFNVGPSSARQRNAISMAFRWRADNGPLIVVFSSFLHSSTKKKLLNLDPL